ncbi:hypothetical protein IE53DRAFT_336818, partial [Violaceomyces palustris]
GKINVSLRFVITNLPPTLPCSKPKPSKRHLCFLPPGPRFARSRLPIPTPSPTLERLRTPTLPPNLTGRFILSATLLPSLLSPSHSISSLDDSDSATCLTSLAPKQPWGSTQKLFLEEKSPTIPTLAWGRERRKRRGW